MREQVSDNPATVRPERSNLFGPFLDSFAASLEPLGYTVRTVRTQLWWVTTFGRWLEARGNRLEELDDSHAGQFFEERRTQGRPYRGLPAVLRRFLALLREHGIISPPPVPPQLTPLEQLERQYERYLRVERGLSPASIVTRLHFVRRFLREKFDAGPPLLRELHAPDVSDFLLRRAPTMSLGSTRTMVAALRSFFRFLLQHGEIDIDLARNIPSVARWRLATIPKYIEPEQVECLLSMCNRDTAVGRRDYAILLLLAREGLRAGEVMRLELDDIHWRAGELRIRGKGPSVHQIPLLKEVGEAMAAYLRQDRPRCSSRRVFIRMKAPHRGFDTADAVGAVVNRALRRANLDAPIRGAHLLRHSLATRLLRNGASMLEIGELLRHKHSDTTEIYAKVDLGGLQSLARPWFPKGGTP